MLDPRLLWPVCSVFVVLGKYKLISFLAYEGQSGSKDRGDPEVIGWLYPYLHLTEDAQTSNVFVANLPPHVTEQSLGNFFARVGPVGSVGLYVPSTLFRSLSIRLKLCGHAATGPSGLVQI